MSRPDEPNEEIDDLGPTEEPEFTEARVAEMDELNRHAGLVEETTPPDDDEDGEQ